MDIVNLTPLPLEFGYTEDEGQPRAYILGDRGLFWARFVETPGRDAKTEAQFHVLARLAFDVMRRRGWGVIPCGSHGWCVVVVTDEGASQPRVEYVGTEELDPFTALIEADRRYAEKAAPSVR